LSPRPYVRAQVFFLAVLVALAALFDAATLAVCCGSAALAWLVFLHAKYLRDVKKMEAGIPPHRRQLDRIVLGDGLVMLLAATLFAAVFLLGSADPLEGHAAVHDAAVALAPTAGVVWGSSLVDWYLILPRISGQLGARPCRAAFEEEWFTFPWTWKEVTRWWYIHRVIGTLVFRLGLSAAIAAVVAALTGLDLLAEVIASIAMLLFGAYAAATLARGIAQAGHAKAIVGQTVKVDRRGERRRWWQPWRKLEPLQLDGRRYVVDVALESVQLAEVDPREAENLPPRFEKDFDGVPLSDVNAIHQTSPKFSGCEGRCSGINWYCIENPRCFDPK
jgi:hypothetical protein